MIAANWPAPSNVKAFFTTREGGVSQFPFSSNNLGVHVGDCPIAVSENRDRLANLLPNMPVWLTQTHSVIVHQITNQDTVSPIEADASITKVKNAVCCVMTADCLPILISNQQGTIVAAIHAGWRGLVDGIIERTISQFNQNPKELIVWLGPAIGPNKFEVGDDVYSLFLERNSLNENGFKSTKKKYLANIYQLAKNELSLFGVTHIYGGEYCTVEQELLFFSYRRDGQTGRMASIIWIE